MALLSFIRPAIPQPRRGGGLVWTGLKGRMAETKFFSQPCRRADGIAQFHPPGHTSGEAEVWSGLKGRMAETKFFSQPCRRADGIAQFHPPGHTSAEARRRTGLD
jgi:hypothetical protein